MSFFSSFFGFGVVARAHRAQRELAGILSHSAFGKASVESLERLPRTFVEQAIFPSCRSKWIFKYAIKRPGIRARR